MTWTKAIDGSSGDPIWASTKKRSGVVLEAVPEFVSRYLELVADADDHPGAEQTFTEARRLRLGAGPGAHYVRSGGSNDASMPSNW